MTVDNLPALRTTTDLAVIPKPTTPARPDTTAGSLFLLAGLSALFTGFAPAGNAPIHATIGMGATAVAAAGLGLHERRRSRHRT